MRTLSCLAFVLALVLLTACGGNGDGAEPAAGGHAHGAPRGGVLVVLAEEIAHVELVFDATNGQIDLYGLGPHASEPMRMEQEDIRLFLYRGGEAIRVILLPVASELTGETVGDTSHYAAADKRLVGAEKWKGRIQSVGIRGDLYEQVKVAYPPSE